MIATHAITTADRAPAVAVYKPAPPRPQTPSNRRLYALLFVVGFLLRFAFMLWRRTYLFHPAAVYEVSSIADHLARGNGFSSPFVIDTGPTAWIAPLYPYFVAMVFRVFGVYTALSTAIVLTVQCLMGGATAIAILALGRRTFGERIGLWSAWIWALSPFFFRWPVSWIWDTTFSGLALALVLILTLDLEKMGTTKLWVRLGGLWGAIALTNPALLSVMPLTIGYAAVANHRARRPWLRSFAASMLLFLAMISPWLIRNAVVFGQPVFLRSNWWFEFHLGNYHYSNGMGFRGRQPASNARELGEYKVLGEMQYVQRAKEASLQFVREHPTEFASLTLLRTISFWDGSFLPLASHEWWKPWQYWPLSAMGWVGFLLVLTRRPRGWLLFLGSMLLYPIPYYLTYPMARYRYALEPELVLLSVFLGHLLWNELEQAKRRHSQQFRSS